MVKGWKNYNKFFDLLLYFDAMTPKYNLELKNTVYGNQNIKNQFDEFDEYVLNTFHTICQNKKTIVFDMYIDKDKPTYPPHIWKRSKDLPNLLLHPCVVI
eukprot:64995_1